MKKKLLLDLKLLKSLLFLVLSAAMVLSCDDIAPEREETPELITKVVLTFTPMAGGPAVIGTANDPDGDGLQNMTPDAAINLNSNTSYSLEISLLNGLADPSSAAYDVSAEVKEEADEHLFFFGWSGGLFQNPQGDGNIEDRDDNVDYSDTDANGLPLGLVTAWTTGPAENGTFRIVLKHQPNLKSLMSGSDIGESDLDVEFNITID
ncbi:MAG: hypothetical protein WKF87_17380 [Chryseolinea sp.]